jgi:predicted O-methyltransferase YrrM
MTDVPRSADPAARPESDPLLLYKYRDSLYAPDMLVAGLHLDVFTWLADRPATHDEVCRAFGLAARPADVMLTLFAAMDLLVQRDGRFHLTPTATEFLVKGSPWFMGAYYPAVEDRPIAAGLLEVLRTGKPATWASRTAAQDWHTAMERDEFAESFTAAMDCRGAYLAPAVARAVDLAGYAHVLDIAGGSGVYACGLAAHVPNLRATVLEKPPVDGIARTAVARRGLSERVSVVTGDMLADALPPDADVHLFSNVLHDWDEPVVRDLLRKSFEALPGGGMVVVHGAHLNAAKDGPLHVAEYSVLLVHASEGRCYSVAEMHGFMRHAGFGELTFTPGAAGRSIITGRKAR